MKNKPCVSCTKPLNGGVYKRPNECPHCSALQNSVCKPAEKPLSLEEAIAASRRTRAAQRAGANTTLNIKASAKAGSLKSQTLSPAQIEARKRNAAKAKLLEARKAQVLKQKRAESKAAGVVSKKTSVAPSQESSGLLKVQEKAKAVRAINSTKKDSAKKVLAVKEKAKLSNNPFIESSFAKSSAQQKVTNKNVTNNPFLTALNKPSNAKPVQAKRRVAL